jgi:poly-beta-hydroxybutyrate-responsive repressor
MASKNGKNNKTATVEDTLEQFTELTEKGLEQAEKVVETMVQDNVEAAKTIVQANVEVAETVAQASVEPLEEVAEVKPKNGRRTKVDSSNAEETEAEVGFSPKTFLIPYMLLMLRDSLMHGYAIWEKLMLMGIPGLDESDRATIYRTLRQLEREGKVKSQWDTATDGPARRVYSLTASGENFLQIWAVGLNHYRQSLDFFFKMYTGGTLPSPFDFFPKGKFGNNSKGDK